MVSTPACGFFNGFCAQVNNKLDLCLFVLAEGPSKMAFAAFFSHLPPLLVLLLLSTSLGKKSEQLDKLAKIRAAISSPSSPPRRSAKANVERAVDDDDDSDYRPVRQTLSNVKDGKFFAALSLAVVQSLTTRMKFMQSHQSFC